MLKLRLSFFLLVIILTSFLSPVLASGKTVTEHSRLINKAYSFYVKGQFKTALSYYNLSIRKADKKEILTSMIGIQNCYIKQGNYKKAIETGRKVLTKYPKNLSAMYNNAFSYYVKKDYNSALKYYLKMIAIDKKNLTGLNGASWASYLKKDNAKAKRYLKSGLKYYPANLNLIKLYNILYADTHYVKMKQAYAAYARGYYAASKKLYLNCLNTDEKLKKTEISNTVVGVQNCQIAMREYDDLIRFSKKFLSESTDNPYFLSNLAYSLFATFRYNHAVLYYKKLYSLNKKNIAIIEWLTRSYFLGGKKERAKEFLKDSITSNNNNKYLKNLYSNLDTYGVNMQTAYSFFVKGDYRTALKFYNDSLNSSGSKSSKENLNTKIGIQNCYIALFKYELAYKYGKELYEIDSKNPTILYNNAKMAYQLKKYNSAAQYYLALHMKNRKNLVYISGLSWSCYYSRKEDKARRYVKRGLAIQKNNISLLKLNAILNDDEFSRSMKSAYAFYVKKDYNSAFKYYKKAVENSSKHTESEQLNAAIGIQNCLVKVGEHQKAVRYGKKLLRDNPDNFTILSNMAYSYSNLSDYDKTTEYYLRILRKYKNNPTAMVGLCWTYYYAGKLDKAKNMIRKTLRKNYGGTALKNLSAQISDDPYNLYMGVAYGKYLQKDYNGAKDMYEKAFNESTRRSRKDKMNAVNGMLNCYVKMEKFKYVIEFGGEILDVEPDNQYILANVAFSHFSLRNYSKAIDYYKRIIDKKPSDITSLTGIAWSAYYGNDLELAKKIIKHMEKKRIPEKKYSQVKKLVENAWSAKYDKYYKYMKTAYKYYRNRDADSALVYYRKAQKYYKNKTEQEIINTKLGILNCYVKLKRYSRAQEIGYDILIDSPENQLALSNLGYSHMASQEYEKAIENYQALYAINNSNYSALWGLSWSYYYYGNMNRSLKFIELALGVSDKDQALQDLYKKVSDGLYEYSLTDYLTFLDYSTNSSKDEGTSNDLMFSVVYNKKHRFDAVYTATRVDYVNPGTAQLKENDYTIAYTRVAPFSYSFLYKNIDTNDNTIGSGRILFAGIDNRGVILSVSNSDYSDTNTYQGDIGYRHTNDNYSITTKLSSIWHEKSLAPPPPPPGLPVLPGINIKREYFVFSQDWSYSVNPYTTFNLGYSLGKNELFITNSGYVVYNSPEDIKFLSKAGIGYSKGPFSLSYTLSFREGLEIISRQKTSVLGHTFKVNYNW